MRLQAPINYLAEYCLAVTNDGTLYLSTVWEGGLSSFDLYRAKTNEDDSYSDLEIIGESSNPESTEIDMYVDPVWR